MEKLFKSRTGMCGVMSSGMWRGDHRLSMANQIIFLVNDDPCWAHGLGGWDEVNSAAGRTHIHSKFKLHGPQLFATNTSVMPCGKQRVRCYKRCYNGCSEDDLSLRRERDCSNCREECCDLWCEIICCSLTHSVPAVSARCYMRRSVL